MIPLNGMAGRNVTSKRGILQTADHVMHMSDFEYPPDRRVAERGKIQQNGIGGNYLRILQKKDIRKSFGNRGDKEREGEILHEEGKHATASVLATWRFCFANSISHSKARCSLFSGPEVHLFSAPSKRRFNLNYNVFASHSLLSRKSPALCSRRPAQSMQLLQSAEELTSESSTYRHHHDRRSHKEGQNRESAMKLKGDTYDEIHSNITVSAVTEERSRSGWSTLRWVQRQRGRKEILHSAARRSPGSDPAPSPSARQSLPRFVVLYASLPPTNLAF